MDTECQHRLNELRAGNLMNGSFCLLLPPTREHLADYSIATELL